MLVHLFVFLATVCVLLSFYIVTAKQSVNAVLTLVAVFLLTSVMWFLIEVEYLAIMLILVYVGAVMVLFLFVVMMVQAAGTRQDDISITPIQLMTLIFCLVAPLIFVPGLAHLINPLPSLPNDHSSVTQLGLAMFTDYLYPFILAGIILLAAIVSSVGLTFRGAQNRKSQDIHSQVQVTKDQRLKIMKDGD